MPPHCDTLDGPVVEAARSALEEGDMRLILPFAPKSAEDEIHTAFERTITVRKLGAAAKDLADRWFFETVVRLHREGEGAPYTGLKPAGLDWGPVIPRADKAIASEDPTELIAFMTRAIEHAIRERFERAMDLKSYQKGEVEGARAYTSAMLRFELFAHHLYAAITSGDGHGETSEDAGDLGH